jgi:hypothetical protein
VAFNKFLGNGAVIKETYKAVMAEVKLSLESSVQRRIFIGDYKLNVDFLSKHNKHPALQCEGQLTWIKEAMKNFEEVWFQ